MRDPGSEFRLLYSTEWRVCALLRVCFLSRLCPYIHLTYSGDRLQQTPCGPITTSTRRVRENGWTDINPQRESEFLLSSLSSPDQFIHNMVSQLGRHSSMDLQALMGDDLDHLAQVLAGALQEAHQESEPGGSLSEGDRKSDGEPPAATLPNQSQALKPDKGQDLKQKQSPTLTQQGACFLCGDGQHEPAAFSRRTVLF